MRKSFLLMVVLLLSFMAIVFYASREAVAAGYGYGATYPVKVDGEQVEHNEPSISQEKAVQIAREMFPELLKGKDVDVQLENNYMREGSRIWSLNWNEPTTGGRRMGFFNIYIDADTGALVNLHCNNSVITPEESTTLFTEEAARQKAEEYAKKYRPAEFSHTRRADNEHMGYYTSGMIKDAYTFYWERVENGIPVVGDGINVGVDLFSGRLTSFAANWHNDAFFPQPGTVPEGLINKALKELGLVLCYQVAEVVNSSLSAVPEANLVYELNCPSMLRIRPDSGEALTWDGNTVPLVQYKRFTSLPSPVAGEAPAGTSVAVNRPSQKISQAEAQKKACEFFRKIGIDKEIVRSGSGSSIGDGVFYDEFWNYSISEGDNWKPGKRRDQIDVGIDTFTGEVRNYNAMIEYPGQNDGGAQKVTRDIARDRAVNFIRLISPERLEQVAEEQRSEDYANFEEGYSFNFARLVNGIPFLHDGMRINVSPYGDITNYYCNWHAVRFSSATEMITREEAEKVFLEKVSMKPAYVFPLEGKKPGPGKQPALVLMFDSDRDMGIDASTGQLVAVNMMAVQSVENPRLVVPKEHWAATPLSILADGGLIPAENFDPDGPVSRRDVIRVLMSIVKEGNYIPYGQFGQGDVKVNFADISPNDRDYVIIQSAIRKGILVKEDHFYPDQPALRGDLAVWLVRALGYNEIAEMPAKIELNAADADQVSDKARNYVAIAWGLGLIKGDENSMFRPGDQITWAELASLVTGAAPRLRNVMY